VTTCLAPRTPWSQRRDALEEILRHAQRKPPSRPFAGLIHPDAFPIAPSGEELQEDASFQQERWELFRILLRSFERGGWIIVRPAPRSDTTDALHGYGCVAETSGPTPGANEEEEQLGRTMLGLEMSPAVQSLVWGLVRTGRLRARSATLLLEGASPQTAATVAFETAYDALSIPAHQTAERLALLRGPHVLNGVAGPYTLHEGNIEESRLPKASMKELIERGWVVVGGGRPATSASPWPSMFAGSCTSAPPW
jgi:hypothetical protein